MTDNEEELRRRLGPAIEAVANSLRECAQEDAAAMQRVFNRLTRDLERAKLPSWGAYVASAAAFAAGVCAEDCRRAEAKRRSEGLSEEHVAFICASSFATLMQHYLQEFMARIPGPGKPN